MDTKLNDRSSELCLACGLCCSGALFNWTVINPDELELVRAIGLEPLTHDDRFVFLQPCRAHQNSNCSIYENRFKVCKGFKCELLKNYEKGRLDFETAALHVQKARQLYEKLRQALGLDDNQPFLESSRSFLKQGSEGPESLDFRRQHARLLLDIMSLKRLLQNNFRKIPEKKLE